MIQWTHSCQMMCHLELFIIQTWLDFQYHSEGPGSKTNSPINHLSNCMNITQHKLDGFTMWIKKTLFPHTSHLIHYKTDCKADFRLVLTAIDLQSGTEKNTSNRLASLVYLPWLQLGASGGRKYLIKNELLIYYIHTHTLVQAHTKNPPESIYYVAGTPPKY